jgi:hypothetical protein
MSGEHRQIVRCKLVGGSEHQRYYSSWLVSESGEVEQSDLRSTSRDLSCSESCSLDGMEFFLGRPFGLVGDSNPPPCRTCTVETIQVLKRQKHNLQLNCLGLP